MKKLGLKTLLTLLGVFTFLGTLRAQSGNVPTEQDVATSPRPAAATPLADHLPPTKPILDPMVKQASGCCGTAPRNGASLYGGPTPGLCTPGRTCQPGECDTTCGRLINGFLGEICCPDPCYEPRWVAAANAAFFQDSPRPVTQTRIRWDAGRNYRFPDSAEFFWGKIGTKGPKNPVLDIDYDELWIYQEIAAGPTTSAWVDISYRTFDSLTNPGASGFGDMNVGVKTVLLDRELLLVSSQFRTYIPVGNFTTGLGTGHASIEPSLLGALKLTPSTYLQSQIAYWIPLGASPGFGGSTFHYHFSLNQELWQHGDYINVIGTFEVNGFHFRGQYTDDVGTVLDLANRAYVNLGPGIRIMFCDRADIGLGAVFGVTDNHGPGQLYRTEVRFRF